MSPCCGTRFHSRFVSLPMSSRRFSISSQCPLEINCSITSRPSVSRAFFDASLLYRISRDCKRGSSKLVQPGIADVSAESRSEEHTSELQSRENLVCRLLLEKKKIKTSDKIRNQLT